MSKFFDFWVFLIPSHSRLWPSPLMRPSEASIIIFTQSNVRTSAGDCLGANHRHSSTRLARSYLLSPPHLLSHPRSVTKINKIVCFISKSWTQSALLPHIQSERDHCISEFYFFANNPTCAPNRHHYNLSRTRNPHISIRWSMIYLIIVIVTFVLLPIGPKMAFQWSAVFFSQLTLVFFFAMQISLPSSPTSQKKQVVIIRL